MLTRVEDDLGTDAGMADVDDSASVDGWAVVSVEDTGADFVADDYGDNGRPPATDVELDSVRAGGEGGGMVSSLSATDEYTANGDGDSLLGPYRYLYDGGFGSDEEEESDDDKNLSIPDTVPSNVRSIRSEHSNATGSVSRRRYKQSTLVQIAAIVALGSAFTAYLAWDRSAWRRSALSLEAELKALREEASKAEEQKTKRQQHGQVPPLFGENETEPSILVDNCWVKASATVSLGTCANDVKDNVHKASENAYDTFKDTFKTVKQSWAEAWDATTGAAAAAASGTKTATESARDFTKRTAAGTTTTYKAAADSITKSAGRVADSLTAMTSELLSSETITTMSETIMETNEMVEETLHHLLDQARDAIEDSSTVFLNNLGTGAVHHGKEERSTTTGSEQEQQRWEYGFLGDFVSGFLNATGKLATTSVDATDAAVANSASSFLSRFSHAVKGGIQDSASGEDEKDFLL